MIERGRKVAVTGVGLISPAGIGLDPFWDALREQKSALRRVSRFDPTTFSSSVAGEIDDELYRDLVPPRKNRNTTRATRLALAAARLAGDDAELPDNYYESHRKSVILGTALGGWHEGGQQTQILNELGQRRINPFVANGAPNHNPGVEVAVATRSSGPHSTISNGCPAGLSAIAQGADLIASGRVDTCIVGGVEAPITPLVYAGMGRTFQLATDADPATASRPFDRKHNGMVIAEGACLLVLEDAERAAARGARIHGEIKGSGSSCDAVGLNDVDESGEVAGLALRTALQDAGLQPPDVDFVCSHANSSEAFDRKEARVIASALGEIAAAIPVSSIKGVIGHPFGAAGPLQAATALLAMRHGSIPATANLDAPDPACPLRHVVGESLVHTVRHAVVTSYGFGGVNGFLVLGNPENLNVGRNL